MVLAPWIDVKGMEYMMKEKNIKKGTIKLQNELGKKFVQHQLKYHKKQNNDKPNIIYRRILKTHAPATLLPWRQDKYFYSDENDEDITLKKGIPNGAKIIVIIRNPKDAAVSMYHHAQRIPFFNYDGKFSHFLSELYLKGKVEYGDYYTWYSNWYKLYLKSKKLKNSNKIYFTSYEKLKKNIKIEIKNIGKFINIDENKLTDNFIQKIIDGSKFDAMKKNKNISKGHIRNGKSGSWKNIFTVAQNEDFDKIHNKKINELNLPEELFQFEL